MAPEQAAAAVRTVVNADRSPSDPRPLLEAHVVPLQDEMVRGYRPAVTLLSAVTALVLLIACLNVTGLLLAYGSHGGGSWPSEVRSVRDAAGSHGSC